MLGIYHISCIPHGNPRAPQMASNPKDKASPPQTCMLGQCKAAELYQLMPLAASTAVLPRPSCAWCVCKCKCVFLREEEFTACAHLCVTAFCIVQAIRKTSFTAPVKLARGSPQDVHTPDLPIVNSLNSVSVNLLSTSLTPPFWRDTSELAQWIVVSGSLKVNFWNFCKMKCKLVHVFIAYLYANYILEDVTRLHNKLCTGNSDTS